MNKAEGKAGSPPWNDLEDMRRYVLLRGIKEIGRAKNMFGAMC